MNIVCIICSDLLTPSDDVFHTPCGHIFHFHCVTQWLERSKSCPQCREKTSNNKIHRLYFNFSNNDTILEDPISLQDQVDKLKFQLLLKEKDIKFSNEKIISLEKKNVNLRAEVRKVEKELGAKNSAIYALKEQIKFFKEQSSEVDAAKAEAERLRKKVEDLRSLQVLMDAPASEVDEMISRTRDPTTLVTYISVMKREMTTCLSKRRELRAKVKSLQQELTKISMERNFLSEEHEHRKILEEKLQICKAEKMSLEEKLREQESVIRGIKRRFTASPNQSCGNDTEDETPAQTESLQKEKPEEEKERVSNKESPEKSSQKTNMMKMPDTPELLLKSHGIVAFKERYDDRTMKKGLSASTLIKKRRIAWIPDSSSSACEKGMAYDGYGGHSRLEVFPTPISGQKTTKRLKSTSFKLKKSKLDTGGNQKLGGFVVDLTHDSSADSMF